MSFRSAADQLRRAREMLNMRDDATLDEVTAAVERLRAETAALELIAASRKSIQPRLREVLDECQADYDAEREFGWCA